MKRHALFLGFLALGACENKYDQMKQQAAASASAAAASSASALAQALARASASASASAAPAKEEKPPDWIMAQHFLVAYKGAEKCPRKVTRTKEEARKRADEAHAAALGQMDFADVAKLYSDDPSGAERQGSLGKIDRQSVVKAFGDAAFALKVDEISPVVETQFGFHVIKRTQ